MLQRLHKNSKYIYIYKKKRVILSDPFSTTNMLKSAVIIQKTAAVMYCRWKENKHFAKALFTTFTQPLEEKNCSYLNIQLPPAQFPDSGWGEEEGSKSHHSTLCKATVWSYVFALFWCHKVVNNESERTQKLANESECERPSRGQIVSVFCFQLRS